MSFVGVIVADNGLQIYFCQQCERKISIIPFPTGDILCVRHAFLSSSKNTKTLSISDSFFLDPLSPPSLATSSYLLLPPMLCCKTREATHPENLSSGLPLMTVSQS
ncbi:Hypothetical predicted protein [Olea europaea subsp. europaea]|uniref:Uncharacterized protein n=1 Tax=Olea europaea subsp. europaea TaxID=158383 RepID=A0A8S0UZ72_OLEEU|nr:Hypothetical predicted protein [Olea europaea subsp. europaea]